MIPRNAGQGIAQNTLPSTIQPRCTISRTSLWLVTKRWLAWPPMPLL